MEREESIQTHLKMYLEDFYEEDIQAPFDIVGYSKENHTTEVRSHKQRRFEILSILRRVLLRTQKIRIQKLKFSEGLGANSVKI